MGLQYNDMFWVSFCDIPQLHKTDLLSVRKCKKLSLYLLIYLMFIGQWYQELRHIYIK